MYTRAFFPNGGGDFESTRGTANALLGLPVEDLDAATERAVQITQQKDSFYAPSEDKKWGSYKVTI